MMNYVVSEQYTIKEVMESFEKNHERVVFVENEKHRIIGSLSQGDIIRAVSSGVSVYARINGIINPSFIFLRQNDYERAYEIFKSKRITLIPVVNKEMELISIITLRDIFQYLERRTNA